MTKLVTSIKLDGIAYRMPLDAQGEKIVDADGRAFLTADGPQQARTVARTMNMASGHMPFQPLGGA